ncbi:MAG TPA: EAL domain-containing protein [Acidimicrobiia bacterium]
MLEADLERRWEERVEDERIREAVEARRFHLYYQPVVSVAGGEVVGVEALLRLNSDVGRVRSEIFLPLLDSGQLWGEVGLWVLERACREALPWAADELWLTVNVAAQQLDAGYAAGVLKTLEATGFPPELLCLELTTTAGLRDPILAWTELRILKSRGVGLLIDDFGTAGSSIADLVSFRLDAVKIAPDFVAGLGRDPEADAIVAALVGLAHALDMQAIAEGVETTRQLDRLKALGCDLAQGFHLQRPGDAGTITRFIAGTGHRSDVGSAHHGGTPQDTMGLTSERGAAASP